MKANETRTIGNATVTKQVLRTSIAQRDSAGTKIGRRTLSDTRYIVKAAGRIIDVVGDYSVAVGLAEKA